MLALFAVLLAATDTAEGGIPKTGITILDKWIGIVFALLFAATALATYFAMVVTSLKAPLTKAQDAVGGLIKSVKAVAWGVESSTEDIEKILIDDGMDIARARRLALVIHKKVTGNIQSVSTTARVEPILKPIVRETKNEMKTYKEEAGRASVWLLVILAALMFFGMLFVGGCATAPKEYVDADASYYAVTKPIVDEVMKRQPKDHAARTGRVQAAKEFQIRQAGGTIPETPPVPVDFFDGVFAVPAPVSSTAKPGEGVIR